MLWPIRRGKTEGRNLQSAGHTLPAALSRRVHAFENVRIGEAGENRIDVNTILGILERSGSRHL